MSKITKKLKDYYYFITKVFFKDFALYLRVRKTGLLKLTKPFVL